MRDGARAHLREHRYGRFQRTLTLPIGIQADQVTASFSNGVLTLTLPKADEARARPIQIVGLGRPWEGRMSTIAASRLRPTGQVRNLSDSRANADGSLIERR